MYHVCREHCTCTFIKSSADNKDLDQTNFLGIEDGISTLHHTILTFSYLRKMPFENIGEKGNKSTACRCQSSAVGCLIEDKKSKLKKGHLEMLSFRHLTFCSNFHPYLHGKLLRIITEMLLKIMSKRVDNSV